MEGEAKGDRFPETLLGIILVSIGETRAWYVYFDSCGI